MTPPRITADDVVDYAEQLISADGLAALSVRRLAAELGVSRQIVYTHFAGMNEVFDQLHLRSGQYLTEAVRRLDHPVGSDEWLLSGARSYVFYARQRPAMFELTFGRPVPGYQPGRDATAALRSVFRVEIVGLIETWCEDNAIEIGPAAAVDRARVFWSAIHGLVTLERAGLATESETDQLVAVLTSDLTAGWRRQRPKSASGCAAPG